MNSYKKFRDRSTIQQVGIVLILVAGAIVLTRMLGLLPTNKWVQGNWSSYIALLGLILYLLPKWVPYFQPDDSEHE